ncbi:MAG: HlyD family efflux transporter periplasmic adaptor subunit [Pirellulales bacterium]
MSPVDGQVFRVIQESATVVVPGQPLVEIGNLRDIEVVIDVLSADAPNIKPGDTILIDQTGIGPLAARVRLVEPSGFTKISALGVEEQRVNVVGDFLESAEKLSRLGDEYRIDARIVVWQNANAMKIPSAALFRRGKDWAVFVVRNNRAQMEKVEIGRTNSLDAEVLSGLSVGDRVVNYPSDKVRDGTVVMSRN